MKQFIKNVSSISRLLKLLHSNDNLIMMGLLEKKEKEAEMIQRELINLKSRIAQYRLFFQDPDVDYRSNFVQEFPVNWDNDFNNTRI